MSKSTMKEMELKKTITQVLISVSIFSLVVSWCSPTLLHNQNLHYYFSCNSFHLISFTMNKNCIFLICNAILVVVANTSPFHLPPPASDLDDMLQKRTAGDGDGLPLQTESEVLLLSDKHVMSDESSLSSEDYDEDDDDGEAEEREVDCQEILEHCKESGDEVLISIEDADHQNERQDCWLLDTVDDLDHREEEEEEEEEKEEEEEEDKKKEEEEDGDGDEIEKLSSEELNQKFEDFIRRMKEEFRVNEYEKQQLVLVK